MYGNDATGDCTCAAVYHAIQTWTSNASAIDNEPEDDALLLYEQACGYVSGQPNTDQGGVEQDVLSYWMNPGAPTGVHGGSRQKLAAFVEIDPRNIDDVKLAIATAGVAYIGFNVPDYMSQTPGSRWDYSPGQTYSIIGGHAVIAIGYTPLELHVISWGMLYPMAWSFWSEFVDEAYMLANQDFIESTGLNPAGLSLTELEAQMQALKWGGGNARDKRRRRRRAKKQRRA
jgi:hypothetical protein